MYEIIVVVGVSIVLYLAIGQLPQFQKKRMKRRKNTEKGPFWLSFRRKLRSLLRQTGEKIKQIPTRIQPKEKQEDSTEKKRVVVNVEKSYKKAKNIYQHGDLDTAEKITLRLISIKPSDAKLYYLLHQIYLKKDNIKESVLALREAIKRKEDGFWYMELAELYNKLKKPKQEERALRQALSMNNMIAMRWSKLAQVQLKLDKKGKAIDSIKRALEIEPNNKNYQDIKKKIVKS